MVIKLMAASVVSLLFLSSCEDSKKPSEHEKNSLRVGVTAGPHAVILEHLKKIAKDKGINIEVIEFSDFILPNKALDNGDLNVNSYQHRPFLEEQRKLGLKIEYVANTVLMPLGIYSQKYKNLSNVPLKATITIPNDPTNAGRSLLLLEKVGLLKLKDHSNPTILDITHNPHQLKIIEIEAPQIPRTLQDTDFAVINTDWVLVSGLDPKSAIVKEDPSSSPYTNVIACKEGQKDQENIKKFVDLYQSNEMKSFINERFKGAVLPGF